MRSTIEAVISAGEPTGQVARYFASQAAWAADMRARFAELQTLLVGEPRPVRGRGVALIRELNLNYRTRQPVADLPGVFDDTIAVLRGRGWTACEPPALFRATDAEAEQLASAVRQILARV